MAEESLECHDEAGAGIGEVTELSENMENGRVYFTDRGTYVLLALQSVCILLYLIVSC